MNLKDKETKELISEWVALDKQRKVNAKQANQIKAELQARGLAYIDDHNERYVKFYGDTGSCSVTRVWRCGCTASRPIPRSAG